MKKTSLGILIPVYNECSSLGNLLDKLIVSLEASYFDSFEILIIDDCSNDGTREVIEKYTNRHGFIRSIFKSKHSNVGESFTLAINNFQTFFFSWIPADGEIPTTIFESIPVIQERTIVSHYPVNQGENRTFIRSYLSRGFTLINNVIFNKRIKYYNGTTIYPLELLKNKKIYSRGFTINLELILMTTASGYKIDERPFSFGKRLFDHSKALHLKNIMNVLYSLLILTYYFKLKNEKIRKES
jgi:glycosyltransferase involved in cell wall biosynthesis